MGVFSQVVTVPLPRCHAISVLRLCPCHRHAGTLLGMVAGRSSLLRLVMALTGPPGGPVSVRRASCRQVKTSQKGR
jgi:hypothetical protein